MAKFLPVILSIILAADIHKRSRACWTADAAVIDTHQPEADMSAHVTCPHYCACRGRPVHPTSKLTIQDCSTDPGSDLDEYILSNRHLISVLTILNSHMSALPPTVCNLTKLTSLNVAGNALTDLPWPCLSQLNSLTTITASHNNLSVLRNGIFYGFKLLQSLDLSYNNIVEIEEDVFGNVTRLPHLTSINLEKNRLRSLDPWFLMFNDRVLYLTVAQNDISQFTNRPGYIFRCGMKAPLGRLSIADNKMVHFTDLMTGWSLTETTLIICLYGNHFYMDIRKNPFNCDCTDFPYYRFIHALYKSHTLNELHCKSPEQMYKRNPGRVPLSEFVCHVKDGCPMGCDCIDTPYWMNMTVSCPHAGLVALPETLPRRPKRNYRYHLLLQNNNLTSIEIRLYSQFVQTLDVRGNRINNVSVEALQGFTNLQRLYLDNNQLQRLSVGNSNLTLGSVTEMRFRDNLWNCDCHSLGTKHWFVKHKDVISDWGAILCTYPDRLRGTNLLTLADDQYICGAPPDTQKRIIAISVGGTLAAGIALFILPVILLYVKKIWIYKTFKWHPLDWDECQGEDKQYDVFVSSANEDEFYVEDYLIPRLRLLGFKVCFHRQHFIPGTPILTNIEQAVYKSKRTLVFLSNAFCVSEYCLWEFNLALNQDLAESTHRLVVVKDTSLKAESLDDGMRRYLQRVTYLECESEVFWDNLLYSLPINRLGTPGQDDGGDMRMDDPLLDDYGENLRLL